VAGVDAGWPKHLHCQRPSFRRWNWIRSAGGFQSLGGHPKQAYQEMVLQVLYCITNTLNSTEDYENLMWDDIDHDDDPVADINDDADMYLLYANSFQREKAEIELEFSMNLSGDGDNEDFYDFKVNEERWV